MKWVLIWLVQLNFMLCWSLNHEGFALLKFRERIVNDPFAALSSWKEDVGGSEHCSWFGIQCAKGHVVSLDLKNLCLKGTLAPELGNLLHVKSIILRNNSFCGSIPKDIGDLEELELLDLGYNNLSGSLPLELGYNIPILLLDNNDLSCHSSPELKKLVILSEVQLKETHLTGVMDVPPYTRHNGQSRDAIHLHPRMLGRRLLYLRTPEKNSSPSLNPKSSFFFVHWLRSFGKNTHEPNSPPGRRALARSVDLRPPTQAPFHPPTPSTMPPLSVSHAPPPSHSSTRKTNVIPIVAAVVGGFAALILVVGVCLWRSNKIRDVAPRATGISGQLQKAFVTGTDRSDGFYSGKRSFIEGIPNLKKSELVTACEDFSNIIGSSSFGTIYKGTLSNGVEIAVIKIPVTSAKGWSRNLEKQFRKKIETLSEVNHKNFVNLIGYCEEKKPFTRMLVFEYAPNGSLFEHLHIKEAEHLDWGMRLRVAMGMAYCLEHLHELAPPRTHPNLSSSSVSLSEDYAAKISDFCCWNEIACPRVRPIGMDSLSASSSTPENDVYSFGLVLLEIMTGRIPQSLGNNTLECWVAAYLRGEQPLQALVDPMLRHFDPEQLERISEVVRKCLHPERKQRLTMRDVAVRLKDITGIDRAKATPRLSPLWWAELEVRSVNGE